jgi:hypothetical protein
VRNIEVTYNNEPLFKVVTDISISEDPAIAFGFVPKEGGGDFEVVVTDSDGRRFDERFNPSTTN